MAGRGPFALANGPLPASCDPPERTKLPDDFSLFTNNVLITKDIL